MNAIVIIPVYQPEPVLPKLVDELSGTENVHFYKAAGR